MIYDGAGDVHASAAGSDDEGLDVLVDALSLEDRVRLVTGASAWGTVALPQIGLRAMILSDGPSGVRGPDWDERLPSLSLPSGTALAASWDVATAYRYGLVIAGEARRHGVDVVLGPTINLHRSPLGGRHFEAFSEDPLLTAELAAAYVRGVQDNGVAATLKHYVGNESETDRFHADVQVDERTLHELYLTAFEKPVTDAGAWAVMSAYNSVNGVTNTENDLLTHPLTEEWGFDGVVVSDWTAVRSLRSAAQPQHLAMPGPDGPWGADLVQAVRDGDISATVLDDKVRRLLRLARRVGALDRPALTPRPADPVSFARGAAIEGAVLLTNSGILPLGRRGVDRVAVIGRAALRPRIQGGGSATVVPEHEADIVAALRTALGDRVTIDVAEGPLVETDFTPFEPDRMRHPGTGARGARLTHLDGAGRALLVEDRQAGFILDYGRPELHGERAAVRFETDYLPAVSGVLRLGFGGVGRGRVHVDGDEILRAVVVEDIDQVQGFFDPPCAVGERMVHAEVPVRISIDFAPTGIVDGVPGSLAVTFGAEPQRTASDDELIAAAAEAAAGSDVAVVVLKTTERDETEGMDRRDLNLPGEQDALVAAVAATGTPTVVLVNAGAPVEMPWLDDVAAVMVTWFGGQEMGGAVADILLGHEEPGGRLPTTWPVRLADAPVTAVAPEDGVLRYSEGLRIGYRAWDGSGVAPAFAFGHGLGYTAWELHVTDVSSSPSGGRVSVSVRNRGPRRGKCVLQLYAGRPDSAVDRPHRWLVAFEVVRLDPDEAVEVSLEVPLRSLAHWSAGWQVEPGDYEIRVGTSSIDLSAPAVIRVDGPAGHTPR